MKQYLLAVMLFCMAVAVPVAQATDLGVVTKQQYLDAAAGGLLQAGIQGRVGGALLPNPNQSSLKELGMFPGASGAPTADFNWGNNVWTTVSISWNQNMFTLDVNHEECVLSMQIVPFEKLFLYINSANFFNDGKIQIADVVLDGEYFGGMSASATTFRGASFGNFTPGEEHLLTFRVAVSTTSNQPPFDDALEFGAALVGSVPEPSSVLFVAVGGLSLILRRRRNN